MFFLFLLLIFKLVPPFFSCFSIQSRFADALLQGLAGLKIPPERIYGLGTGLVHVN